MDPVSQAAFGASLAQSFARDRKKQLSALLIGGLAGLAPDLDILINSADDPLLFLEYHRQFSHALIFIPFGALLCALILYPLLPGKRKQSQLSFAQVYVFALLGYATHGLLDACTSYGTQLLWPFSTQRFAWNTVSIIDPLFTVPVLILIVLAAAAKKVIYARAAFVYAVIFLSLGVIQHQRAEQVVFALAQQRGQQVERLQVKPSFANRHLWKLIYEADGRYYVDAVRLLWQAQVITGSSIEKLDVARDLPWLPAHSQQAKDIERFRWFSDGYLAISPSNSNLVMDMRYSFLPNSIDSMWGVEVDRGLIETGRLEAHAAYKIERNMSEETLQRFYQMLFYEKLN